MASATSDLKSAQSRSLLWRACTWLAAVAGLLVAAGAIWQQPDGGRGAINKRLNR
ncbi:MAG TPA: hypothetical protein VI424_07110 [Terriglobales bacterium]|jgi:hypothetical protein